MKRKIEKLSSAPTIFSEIQEQEMIKSAPLSARMRPQSLKEYVGQTHILGEGKLLTRAIESDRLSSLIFYGPPGSGKTTLALCISKETAAVFEKINAVTSNVEEMRKILAAAQNRRATSGRRTVLFIDEIHRFNKAQQDVLMPDLEDGNIVLIGATVLNPFFTLVSPLLSRSLVFELKSLSADEIATLLKRSLTDKERGFGQINIKVDEEAIQFLSQVSDGDARRALNALEIGILTTKPDSQGIVDFTLTVAQESIQKKQVNYDREGDQHYDTISAFIKSMRGSDPDATLYWLAKMIYAGEDLRFISRRICICAAEDVGLADPQALVLAHAAMDVSEFIGLPEAQIPLAQAAVYVACAPKSNAAYLGISHAMEDVKNNKILEIPLSLKDAHYAGAKTLGRGQDYKYAHDFKDHYVAQEYMPQKVKYYIPTDMGYEKKIKAWLEYLREQAKAQSHSSQNSD